MPTPSASDLRPPEDAAVERFRRDLETVFARALDGAFMRDGAEIAVAVSGGPDSMAMLALAAAAMPGRVRAATVDHGLRPEGAAEARMVADACAKLGVPHTTLIPDREISGSSLQMRAREARYEALGAWAAGSGIYPVLTAHHADDQAETLLMRLNRASGISGLAAIRSHRFIGEAVVLRPLLGWRRDKLRAIIIAAGLPCVDDPSNLDERHDRTRIRALLADHPELDAAALAASAGFLAEAEAVLSDQAERLWSERWRGPDRGLLIDDLARELRRRLLRRAILETRALHAIVLPAFADTANIEPLIDSLEAGRAAVQGGVIVRPGRDGFVFQPAPPRRTT